MIPAVQPVDPTYRFSQAYPPPSATNAVFAGAVNRISAAAPPFAQAQVVLTARPVWRPPPGQ